MKTLLLTAAAAAALVAGSASAATMTAFAGYHPALNAGETLVTNFDDPIAAGYALTGDAAFLTGSSGNGAAPAFSASTHDTTQYLSVEGGQSETLSTPALKEISFYIGSLDGYNSISFTHKGGGAETFTGGDLASMVMAADNGDQQSGNTNGRYTFTFDKAITGVTLASGQNSFEISNIGAIGVPEPSTWAMMLVGFGGMGAAIRSRRKSVAA